MTDSTTDTCSSEFSATHALPSPNGVRTRANQDGSHSEYYAVSRQWRDVFWLVVFVLHLILVGFVLGVLGFNRFKKKDRLNIDQYTMGFLENQPNLTEDFWPLYALAGGIGTFLGWSWLLLLGSCANGLIKVSVHMLTTYLAVMSVLCFWSKQFFWGVAFATGAGLQFLYVVSVIDRLPFTMIVLKGSIKMVRNLPEVIGVSYVFMMVLLLWLALWSFGVAGIVALSLGDTTSSQWWLLLIFSVSLFWTGAVICNIVHVIVSGMVFLVLIHGSRDAESMPTKPMLNSVRNAVTKSFGSICYGSLFTAAIRTLRWEVRGFRSKIGKNECLLCFADCIFQLVEILVRFFNKYAYVQIAVSGKNFNYSARDAWELFQSTGVESLIAYDCSGAVLLMGTILGGLVVGTCAGAWAKIKFPNRMIMVGSTSMLMGMILVGLAMVVVESAVTSIYICYAEDPLLIHRWDPEFFNNMSETLHQRLQHRSSRATEVFNRFDNEIQHLQQQQQQQQQQQIVPV